MPGKNQRWKAKFHRLLAVCLIIYKNGTPPQTLPTTTKGFHMTFSNKIFSCYSCAKLLRFSNILRVLISWLFRICRNYLPWWVASIKITFLDLPNLNGSILQLDVRKFEGFAWVGLQNFIWYIVGAVWDLILCINARLSKILSWNTFRILLSWNSGLTCLNLSLQWIIEIACFCCLLYWNFPRIYFHN